MVNILSDNPTSHNNILRLCSHIQEQGAYFDDGISIEESNSHTSVFYKKPAQDNYIIRLPHDILIPYDDFDFDVEGNDIVIAHSDRSRDSRHISILEMMLRIYNDSHKFSTFLDESPFLHFQDNPALIKTLMQSRQSNDFTIIADLLEKPDFREELALLSFFKSRLLYCSLNDSNSPPTAVMIPVMEFMNHHNNGAAFDNLYTKESGALATKAHTPEADSQECFTNYGRFDALDTYLHYGFVDESASFVRSIPIEIDLDGVGRISVGASNVVIRRHQVPDKLQDLTFYFPNIFINEALQTAKLSHLFIPQHNARFSMRRILERIIQSMKPNIDNKACLSAILEAEDKILTENKNYYAALETMKKTIKNPLILDQINALIRIQNEKISHYENLF